MLQNPIWTTWARFKTDVNQAKVLKYAQEIVERGMQRSVMEIDDRHAALRCAGCRARHLLALGGGLYPRAYPTLGGQPSVVQHTCTYELFCLILRFVCCAVLQVAERIRRPAL